MNYSYCIMQMSDGHFFYNDVECDTHGYTWSNDWNKRVETLKSCRRHAKGVVTKVISPLRLLVIILLLLKSNIQFHHECYRTIAALLAQQVVHHKLESDSLCHFHAEVIAYMFVKEMAHSLGFENTAFFTQFFKRFTGSTPQEYRKH